MYQLQRLDKWSSGPAVVEARSSALALALALAPTLALAAGSRSRSRRLTLALTLTTDQPTVFENKHEKCRNASFGNFEREPPRNGNFEREPLVNLIHILHMSSVYIVKT